MNIERGTEIYYTGDMANGEGYGVVSKAYKNCVGNLVNITMDDGREIRGILRSMISNKYTTIDRFMLKSAYIEWRRERMNAWAKSISI